MDINEAKKIITDYAKKNYRDMFRDPEGIIRYPFIVPGSQSYQNCLWDWDSWLTDIAIRQMMEDCGTGDEFAAYEKGCILNFLDHADEKGGIPIVILPQRTMPEKDKLYESNMHKPCLAQHLAFVIEQTGGDASWIADHFGRLEAFIKVYLENYRHETGLFFWLDDFAIGVDNDPATFYRPKKSSGSIYLNCFMYKELSAMSMIAGKLGKTERAAYYENEAETLKQAIRTHCYDERDGFYYSVDFNLLPVDPESSLHKGAPRHWQCLLQRIDSWAGFLAMWAGIATKDEAERMAERYRDTRTFNAAYGVRTLSKLEKMYVIKASGNPSCWLGPIWGISNYLVFSALAKYGFDEEARELTEKTVMLFGSDIASCGEMHEYYHPDSGEPVINPGFQNWNLLSLNMIAYLENRKRICEF